MTTPSTPPAHYDDLRAIYLNCTLKRSPEPSHTQLLIDTSQAILGACDRQPRRHQARRDGPAVRLQHLGYSIAPQADAGWIGEAGPGPSYGDELADGRRAGFDNDFTRRNTTFMTWNMLHLARMLKDAGGLPAHGNQRTAWDAGARFDHPNPAYR